MHRRRSKCGCEQPGVLSAHDATFGFICSRVQEKYPHNILEGVQRCLRRSFDFTSGSTSPFQTVCERLHVCGQQRLCTMEFGFLSGCGAGESTPFWFGFRCPCGRGGRPDQARAHAPANHSLEQNIFGLIKLQPSRLTVPLHARPLQCGPHARYDTVSLARVVVWHRCGGRGGGSVYLIESPQCTGGARKGVNRAECGERRVMDPNDKGEESCFFLDPQTKALHKKTPVP